LRSNAITSISVAATEASFKRRRTSNLQQRFGHEYDRAVQPRRSRRKAEAELARVSSGASRSRSGHSHRTSANAFSSSWQQVQTQFVDDPAGSVTRADALIASIMSERGYPDGRLRPAGRGHLNRPSTSGGALTLGARDRPEESRRGDARGPPPGDQALPGVVRKLVEAARLQRESARTSKHSGGKVTRSRQKTCALTRYRSFFNRLLSV
jgi:hypothetical protein